MKITVDLTRENFDSSESVTFYDSKTIFFDPTNILPENISFKVWGAGLMPDFKWEKYIELEKEKNIKLIRQKTPNSETTIKGFGILTFTNVVAGKIEIQPYDNNKFLKNKNGDDVIFKREWKLENIDENCYEYFLDTSIFFPYGASSLSLFTKGNVTFEFDTNDCVDYFSYITNQKKAETFWGYLKDKDLTTNSLNIDDFDFIK